MAATGVEQEVLDLVAIFIIAAGVGVFVAKVGRFPYTIALLIAGFGASIVGVGTEISIPISHDIILFVLLPPLLFEGAANTELEQFRRNFPPIITLAVVGLLISVTVLGAVAATAFNFPFLIALLFAAMILPTDPVSVLALFKELGVPDRLAVLVEGESLLNDGTGVVLYTVVLGLIETRDVATTTLGDLLHPAVLGQVAVEIVYVAVGGALVGLAGGYAVYRVMYNLDEPMTETVLALILAYGSFLLAEHFFHVSGVIACVVAGLFIGNRAVDYAMSPQTKITVYNTFDTGAFLANTFIFIMIGVRTPLSQLVQYAGLIALAIPLVLIARAVGVYPVVAFVNRVTEANVTRDDQHVLWWAGLHASIPIALVLGLPQGTPYRPQLRALVFGVAAFSLVVQGLTMKRFLDFLGVVTRSDAEQLYELLSGRTRAVDEALDAADRLKRRGDLPGDVYDEFTAEYGGEREELGEVITELLRQYPELRYEQKLAGERRVLKQEKSAVMDAMRRGIISDDVGEQLVQEVDLKLDQVQDGETTISAEGEGYEEFWRERAREYGLDVARDRPDDSER